MARNLEGKEDEGDTKGKWEYWKKGLKILTNFENVFYLKMVAAIRRKLENDCDKDGGFMFLWLC